MIPYLFLNSPFDSLPSWQLMLIIFGLLFSLFLLIVILGSIGYARKVRSRAITKSLCSWEYSASEWLCYAKLYDLSKNPQGAARVKVTPLDIWIIDESRTIRLELNEKLKGVTDCRLANDVLKVRVLWVNTGARGRIKRGAEDFQLFVPVGREADALKAAAYFKENKARSIDKFALICRYNNLDPLVKNSWHENFL